MNSMELLSSSNNTELRVGYEQKMLGLICHHWALITPIAALITPIAA